MITLIAALLLQERPPFGSAYYWPVYGLEVIAAFQLALVLQATTLAMVIVLHLASKALLLAWFTPLAARKFTQRAYEECLAACEAAFTIPALERQFLGSFHTVRGTCLYEMGQFNAAIDAFTRALDVAPLSRVEFGEVGMIKKALVHSNRGDAWFKLGRYGEALAD